MYKVELTVLLPEKPDPETLIYITISDSCIGGKVHYGEIDHVGEIIKISDDYDDDY